MKLVWRLTRHDICKAIFGSKILVTKEKTAKSAFYVILANFKAKKLLQKCYHFAISLLISNAPCPQLSFFVHKVVKFKNLIFGLNLTLWKILEHSEINPLQFAFFSWNHLCNSVTMNYLWNHDIQTCFCFFRDITS